MVAAWYGGGGMARVPGVVVVVGHEHRLDVLDGLLQLLGLHDHQLASSLHPHQWHT